MCQNYNGRSLNQGANNKSNLKSTMSLDHTTLKSDENLPEIAKYEQIEATNTPNIHLKLNCKEETNIKKEPDCDSTLEAKPNQKDLKVFKVSSINNNKYFSFKLNSENKNPWWFEDILVETNRGQCFFSVTERRLILTNFLDYIEKGKVPFKPIIEAKLETDLKEIFTKVKNKTECCNKIKGSILNLINRKNKIAKFS